ncbi:hypothetical protein BU24DRAFT_453595 [Aaosphaeria arxii CBS 175.79]|uniref:Uncharacterized protein n=1 Tax=Aaosphaeria arxii CBS 175.79 TaxID=1450172 RepID=A0A6A5XGT4_9PLEO|nr:uncharacterized protein BU24DRAFT_453595 [Aaosphaeria arxii CBS 175.79]KAF2012143.1 hypothetical protein BU24DRAFT_453595 [Aaosphaeria arxii CBS 175.79]
MSTLNSQLGIHPTTDCHSLVDFVQKLVGGGGRHPQPSIIGRTTARAGALAGGAGLLAATIKHQTAVIPEVVSSSSSISESTQRQTRLRSCKGSEPFKEVRSQGLAQPLSSQPHTPLGALLVLIVSFVQDPSTLGVWHVWLTRNCEDVLTSKL